MSNPDPDHDHPEAMTLALHEASPPHMVDAMVDDVVLELGWGRLIFGQTFADPEKLAEVLRQEGHGRRDICIYARDPMSWCPRRLLSCSSTRATRIDCGSPRARTADPCRPGSVCARCRAARTPTR